MSDSSYRPTPHPQITVLASQGEIWLSSSDAAAGIKMTLDEARLIGLRLMESALYELDKSKKPPTEGNEK